MSNTIPTQIPAPSTSEFHININSVSFNIGVASEVPTTTRSYLQIFRTYGYFVFERRYHKQNSVSRLESSIWAPPNYFPPKKFWAGYATVT